MSASDRILIGCTLLVMCAVGNGAANAEPEKRAAATTTTSAANSLPAFLDQRRLADIQEVWDTRAAPSGPTRTEAARRDAQQQAKAQATVQTARAAMKRAQQASEDAAVVRRRAEEISRRFSAGAATVTPAPAAPEGAPESAEVALVEPAQPSADAATPTPGAPKIEHTAAVHAPPVGSDTGPAKPYGVGGPVPDEATESTPNVAAIEVNTTVGPIPPTPQRKAGAAKVPRSKAKVGSGPKPGGKTKSDAGTKLAANTKPPEPNANKADSSGTDEDKSSTMSEVFSGFLRAFGWNSQPE